jgi:alkanesulfonate monooxygenase SsuD/methylene tetrahydromethanopterin reductase-like flavin-dependent oxidoreductase (luciferase family)
MSWCGPIRLAEDLAVLDNLSNGRVEIGVGTGYAPHEFRGFGLPVSRRLSLTDEGLAVLRHSFTGETFSFRGKRYDFSGVKITPGSVRKPVATAASPVLCGKNAFRKPGSLGM